MRNVSFLRWGRACIVTLVCVHVAVLALYVYGRGTKGLRMGQSLAMADDKVKIEQKLSLDDVSGFELLEKKRREVDEKEAALKRKEEELSILKKDIEGKLAKLSELQDQVQKSLDSMKQQGDARLKHVVGAYSAMKPNKAAGLIEKLDDDVALQILSAMKSKDVGGILSFVNTDKAAKLSQRLAEQAK